MLRWTCRYRRKKQSSSVPPHQQASPPSATTSLWIGHRSGKTSSLASAGGCSGSVGALLVLAELFSHRPADPLYALGSARRPLIAVLSFVCSIGNVPLAAVLWNGGMSFGGVMAFIFADLIVLPILNIYRKYYGGRVSMFLFATFYVAMAFAGLIVDLVFEALGLVPAHRNAKVVEASIELNYTTVLNVIFLILD